MNTRCNRMECRKPFLPGVSRITKEPPCAWFHITCFVLNSRERHDPTVFLERIEDIATNPEEKEVFRRVVNENLCSIWMGVPGAGKSSTIKRLVKIKGPMRTHAFSFNTAAALCGHSPPHAH